MHDLTSMLLDRELDRNRLVSRVGALTGLTDREHIERAIEATMEVLAEYRLASEYDPERFYHQISEREGTSLGFAMEHAQVVLQVIAEMMGEEDRQRLIRHLPDEMESLLRPPKREPGLPPRGHVGSGHTLATARPGSAHPLAESRAERAQSQSIARTPAPHGDTNVATTHGIQKAPSLASGKPGSERPLVDVQEE